MLYSNHAQFIVREDQQTLDLPPVGMDIPMPIGGLNLELPSHKIEDHETPDALNKWINKSGRLASFWGNTEHCDFESTQKPIRQYNFDKDISTSFHLIAHDDGSNLILSYIDTNGDETVIDSSMTTGETIAFEQYMNKYGVLLDSGTSESGTATTITDTDKTWTTNQFKGKLIILTDGTGLGQLGLIEGNDGDTITVKEDWIINPAADTTYEIRELAFSVLYNNKTDGLRSWNGDSNTTLGDSTTQFDITNPSGTTIRYTYDSTGTDPDIDGNMLVGQQLVISAENFDTTNNGTFIVTAVDTNYFEVTNATGTIESDKTIGTGSIEVRPFIPHPDAPKGDVMIIHRDILFISGNSTNGASAYASKEYDVTNFSQNRSETIGWETVDPITNVGIYSGNLIFFKKKATVPVVLSTDGDGNLVWSLGDEDITRGCINNKSLQLIDGQLIVMDELGVYMYGYAENISVLGFQNRISDKIKPFLDDCDLSDTFMYYDDLHDQVYIGVTYQTATTNSHVIVFDWKRSGLVQAWWLFNMEVNSMVKYDGLIYFGHSNDNKVYYIDESKYLTNSYCKTKAFNLGSDYLKENCSIRFTAKNVESSIGLKVILQLDTEAVEAYDNIIYSGSAATFENQYGTSTFGASNFGGGAFTRTINLNFLKKYIPLPFYQYYYLQLDWYNDDASSFELDSQSVKSELLSEEHDPFSIYA